MRFGDIFRKAESAPAPYIRYESEARLYEYADKLIVCSVAGIAETDSLSVLAVDAPARDLGTAVMKHLGEFELQNARSMCNDKLADWAAYRVSGASSGKAFESHLWHVDLALMNSAVLVWARPRLSLRDAISAYTHANRHNNAEGIGEAVRMALAAAKALRGTGLI